MAQSHLTKSPSAKSDRISIESSIVRTRWLPSFRFTDVRGREASFSPPISTVHFLALTLFIRPIIKSPVEPV